MTNATKHHTKAKTRKGCTKWTPYYDRRLKELYRQGDLTVDEIAEKLGRSRMAVYHRAQVIGARRYNVPPRPKPAVNKQPQPVVKKRRSWLDWLLGA